MNNADGKKIKDTMIRYSLMTLACDEFERDTTVNVFSWCLTRFKVQLMKSFYRIYVGFCIC